MHPDLLRILPKKLSKPDLLTLTGKTVAITGATGGIGSAIAARFARNGARLVLIGQNPEKLWRLRKSLMPHTPRFGTHQKWEEEAEREKQQQPYPDAAAANAQGDSSYCPHEIETLPLTDPNHWEELTKKHSAIDILVNCAGVTQERLLVTAPYGSISKILDINLIGTILGCKYVGLQMMRRRAAARRVLFGGSGSSGSSDDANDNPPDTNRAEEEAGCIINVSSLLAEKGVNGTSVYAASKAGIIGKS